MVENLIVALIVGGSAWYAGAKYLPASVRRKLGQKPATGCGSGCDSCGSCESAAPGAASASAPAGKHRVITLHKI